MINRLQIVYLNHRNGREWTNWETGAFTVITREDRKPTVGGTLECCLKQSTNLKERENDNVSPTYR